MEQNIDFNTMAKILDFSLFEVKQNIERFTSEDIEDIIKDADFDKTIEGFKMILEKIESTKQEFVKLKNEKKLQEECKVQ